MNASLFDALGQLLQWFASWIPRLQVMPATHRGIRFRRGKIVRVIEPGLYIYLPITTEVESLPVKRQTVNLPTQTLKTKDGTSVAVNVVVVYEITDIERALVDTWDIEQTISDVALVADVEIVTNNTLEWLTTNIAGEVEKALTRRTRSELHPYGVRVIKAFLSDLCDAHVLRLLSNEQLPKIGLGKE